MILKNKRKFSKLKRFLFFSLISLLIKNTSQCPQNCSSCKTANQCERCEYGYGLIEGKCNRCTGKNCKYCDGNVNSCETCSIFHYKEESKEIRGAFECKKCGFGCMTCENEDKCEKCGKMFKFSSTNKDQCIADHRTLFFIMILILLFLIVTITLGFYCTNLTPEQEKEMILRYIDREKERLGRENNLDEEALDGVFKNVENKKEEEGKKRSEDEPNKKKKEVSGVKDQKNLKKKDSGSKERSGGATGDFWVG